MLTNGFLIVRLIYVWTSSDLRNNHLASVNDKMFDGLDSLKNLLLAGNQLLYIDNNGFHGLAALQLL